MSPPREMPSQPDGSGTISLAAWNIHSRLGGGLEAACRSPAGLDVSIAVLQATKVANGLHICFSSGYSVIASKAISRHRRGVALVWREGNAYEVEETRFYGPNVMTFQLVTGADQYYVVRCYIPPFNRTTLDDVRTAWGHCPSGARPLLVGDLNVNLESPGDKRGEEIAEQVGYMNLTDMSGHFCQRRQQCTRERWTWRQRRDGRWISTKPDYFLAQEDHRRYF